MIRIDLREPKDRLATNKSVWFIVRGRIYDDLDSLPAGREPDYTVVAEGEYVGSLPQWKASLMKRMSAHLQANSLRGLYTKEKLV